MWCIYSSEQNSQLWFWLSHKVIGWFEILARMCIRVLRLCAASVENVYAFGLCLYIS